MTCVVFYLIISEREKKNKLRAALVFIHHVGCDENSSGFRLHQVITAAVITFMPTFICRGGEILLSAEMVDERPTLGASCGVTGESCAFRDMRLCCRCCFRDCQVNAINLNENLFFSTDICERICPDDIGAEKYQLTGKKKHHLTES